MGKDEKLKALYRGKDLEGRFIYSHEDRRIVLDSCSSDNGRLVYHFRQVKPDTNNAIEITMHPRFQRNTKRVRNLAAGKAFQTITLGPYAGEERDYIPPQQERESTDRRRTA